MSRSVDLFIDASQPIDEMAAILGELIDSPIVDSPASGGWVLSQGDVQATLREHPFVDDSDLPFTHFKYALSARVSDAVRLQDSPATTFLRRVADRIQRGLGLPVLLVLDLQYRDQTDPCGAAEPDPAPHGPGEAPDSPEPAPVAGASQ
jgi:hypothetical protein